MKKAGQHHKDGAQPGLLLLSGLKVKYRSSCDESGNTGSPPGALDLNVNRRRRSGHLDELAATYILQTFLTQ
jgi:RNase H-fold protein (predicted Holliday junction resolvase)